MTPSRSRTHCLPLPSRTRSPARRGMRFQIKRDRERSKSNTPIDYSLVWFWGALWSGPVWPTLTAETPWSTRAHPYWQRERKGRRETAWQVAITKTTTVRFHDGCPGENQWVIKSGWARCCVAMVLHLCNSLMIVTEERSCICLYIVKQTCFLINLAFCSWKVRGQGHLQVSFSAQGHFRRYMNRCMNKVIFVC